MVVRIPTRPDHTDSRGANNTGGFRRDNHQRIQRPASRGVELSGCLIPAVTIAETWMMNCLSGGLSLTNLTEGIQNGCRTRAIKAGVIWSITREDKDIEDKMKWKITFHQLS